MTKKLSQYTFLIVFILALNACSHSTKHNDTNFDLSRAVVVATPKQLNLSIDTQMINSGNPVQKITLVNIGNQPATHLLIREFKDESTPLTVVSNCDKDLAAGASCEVKIKLYTNFKFAESNAISRTTNLMYEYDNGEEIKESQVPIKFSVEKWVASVFLTDAKVNGNILYPMPDELPLIKAGADSADWYCEVDKNNPKNGYRYNALIFDTTSRTPYLEWVLIGGQNYFSVMPNAYHQKVWETAYDQAMVTNIFTHIYNCIGLNCLLTPNSGDEKAWTGFKATNYSLNAENCGSAGNAWKSNDKQLHGDTFSIHSGSSINSLEGRTDSASCNTINKIICVSQ